VVGLAFDGSKLDTRWEVEDVVFEGVAEWCDGSKISMSCLFVVHGDVYKWVSQRGCCVYAQVLYSIDCIRSSSGDHLPYYVTCLSEI
jgi:hypothetical protein